MLGEKVLDINGFGVNTLGSGGTSIQKALALRVNEILNRML